MKVSDKGFRENQNTLLMSNFSENRVVYKIVTKIQHSQAAHTS
jgi:hypothetical protein